MPEKICSICSKSFSLHQNFSGLVFNDEHFVCEECCTTHSDKELINWSKTIMQSPENGMPIGLWLMHEQNKDKTMMTVQR